MRHARWLFPLILAAAVVAIYLGSLGNPFIFDDETAIVENPHIRSLWPPWAPLVTPDDTPLTGRPLVSLTLAFNHAAGGLSPAGYHAVSVVLHALAALALFGLVRRALETERLAPRFGEASRQLAFAVALLWAVHPLLTEAVCYAIQRTELLMGLFLLTTLYAALRAAGAAGKARTGWTAAAVAACFAGMASKEVMVVAPLLVLVFDRVLLAGSWREALTRRRGLYAGLAASWLLLAALLATGSRGGSAGFGLEVSSFEYLRTQAGVILHYLRLALWPRPLVLDYDDWPLAGWGEAAPAILAVAAILGATIWALLRRSQWALPGAFFFFVLAPTSSLLPITTEVAAERRMYLPLAAVVAAAVLGLWALGGRLGGRGRPLAGLILLVALAVPLAVASRQRVDDYRSALAIWQDTVSKRPANSRAHNNLGVALLAEGRTEEALARFERSAEQEPNAPAHSNLGLALAERGEILRAIEEYEKALALEPASPATFVNLGNALFAQGNAAGALARFEKALAFEPDLAEGHNGRGMALWSLGRREEALGSFTRAVELDPGLGNAQLNLGTALAETGRLAEAEEPLRRAADLAPDDPRPLMQLGQTLARQDRLEEAEAAFREAIASAPKNAEAHFNLGRTLISQGRLTDGMVEYEAAYEAAPAASLALSLAWTYATHRQDGVRDPAKAVRYAEAALELAGESDPVALDTLAAAYAAAGRFEEAVRRARSALDLARQSGQADLEREIGTRLTLYRRGEAFRVDS